MPAAEAASYEFAFHILPTVAEGEVANVFQNLKDIIAKNGGSLTVEENPARVELEYEIIKYLEGRNRKFTSAYFGWIRFTAEPAAIEELTESIEGVKEILRHLMIRLSKVEEANPFYLHEALEAEKAKAIDVDAEAAPEVVKKTKKVEKVEEKKESEDKEDKEEVEETKEESEVVAEAEEKNGEESEDKV